MTILQFVEAHMKVMPSRKHILGEYQASNKV